MQQFFSNTYVCVYFRYIFKAFVRNSNSKVKQAIASLLCFFFVIIWHGGRTEIIIWTTINYIEVVLEKAGSNLLRANCFLSFYNVYLHPSIIRRITALLSVPLFCVSSISQYYFFGTYESVQLLIMRIKQGRLQIIKKKIESRFTKQCEHLLYYFL